MSLLEQIENLYRELPRLNCKECGLCCVSPTCTLAEFLYLAHYLQENVSREQLINYLTKPAEIHPDYEGNLRCIFLENKRCSVHPGRTAACRLFGIPSLSEMNIANLEECKNNITIAHGDGSIAFVKAWLKKLVALDAGIYDFDAEPYYIKGFTIQCWFDIYFDETFDFDVFNDIKNAMNHHFDLSSFTEYYTLKTGLKEKIDTISIVASLIDAGDKETLKKALYAIKNNYPLTGTYYYDEVNEFLNVIEER